MSQIISLLNFYLNNNKYSQQIRLKFEAHLGFIKGELLRAFELKLHQAFQIVSMDLFTHIEGCRVTRHLKKEKSDLPGCQHWITVCISFYVSTHLNIPSSEGWFGFLLL